MIYLFIIFIYLLSSFHFYPFNLGTNDISDLEIN